MQFLQTTREALYQLQKTKVLGGIVLLVSALAALILTNTAAHDWYERLLVQPLPVALGPVVLEKTLIHWVNDGLMAIFFFLVGLELKHEFDEGHLSTPSQAIVPAFAAVGGMLVPALLFTSLNHHDDLAMRGWAIPTATDIAFSLGVLRLLGARIPAGLMAFLLALAILDDLGAVLIIALYYSNDLSMDALRMAAFCLTGLIVINRFRVQSFLPYLLLGLPLWYFVLKSGVHATMAGVLLAFTIPAGSPQGPREPLLLRLEHNLYGWVTYGVLPIFAFCNAGVYLLETVSSDLGDALTLGVLLGLLVGKPVGICLFTWFALMLKLGHLPQGVHWWGILGMSFLCGIGFTMSLFVSSLAHVGLPTLIVEDRIGIMLGSLLSAVIGYLILRATFTEPKPDPEPDTRPTAS